MRKRKEYLVKEFSSREDMMAYEDARENYLASRMVHICGLGNFYKYLFLDIFHPKYRKIMKEYESYYSGYWRDDYGHVWSICSLPTLPDYIFKDGDIFVFQSRYEPFSVLEIYVYKCDHTGNGYHIKISDSFIDTVLQ